MKVSKQEIARYLGYRHCTLDAATEDKVSAILAELEKSSRPRNEYKVQELTFEEDGGLLLGPIRTASRDLSRNLTGCERILLMAATLGTAPDYMIRRYEKLDLALAAIAQAVSAAMIEAYIEEQLSSLAPAFASRGLNARPRFSPGYGDFPLSVQPAFVSALQLSKRLGITLTDGLLMLPTQSVTAVMGLAKTPGAVPDKPCENCGETGCEYRAEIQTGGCHETDS